MRRQERPGSAETQAKNGVVRLWPPEPPEWPVLVERPVQVETEVRARRSLEARKAFRKAVRWLKGRKLGHASRRAILREYWFTALGWVDAHFDPNLGEYDALAHRVLWVVVQGHLKETGQAKIRKEFRDERRRAGAQLLESERVLHYERWRGRLVKLANATRFRIPGYSEEELVDALSLRLLEAMQSPRGRCFWRPYEAVGAEATYLFLARERDAMRRRQDIYLRGCRSIALANDVRDRQSAFQRVDREERRLLRPGAIQAAKAKLTPIDRQWLSAFELAARNWRAQTKTDLIMLASANMKRDRTTAHKALARIREVFAMDGLHVFLDCDTQDAPPVSRTSTDMEEIHLYREDLGAAEST